MSWTPEMAIDAAKTGFRLVELAYRMGSELLECLPSGEVHSLVKNVGGESFVRLLSLLKDVDEVNGDTGEVNLIGYEEPVFEIDLEELDTPVNRLYIRQVKENGEGLSRLALLNGQRHVSVLIRTAYELDELGQHSIADVMRLRIVQDVHQLLERGQMSLAATSTSYDERAVGAAAPLIRQFLGTWRGRRDRRHLFEDPHLVDGISEDDVLVDRFVRAIDAAGYRGEKGVQDHFALFLSSASKKHGERVEEARPVFESLLARCNKTPYGTRGQFLNGG